VKAQAVKIAHRLWYMIAAAIILIALLVTIMRWLTPVLNEHRADFEKLASNLLQMPVMIRSVAVSWHGYSPQISLENVMVLDPDTQKPKINLQHLAVAFNIWRSIVTRTPSIHNIILSGVNLTVTQAATGLVQVGELTSLNIKDSLTGSSVETNAAFAWTFAQPSLELEDIHILYISPDNPDRALSLSSLVLLNKNKHHIVDGKAILNQSLPIKMHVHFDWDGDVRKLSETKGNAYVYFEGLSLAQWFSKATWQNVQVKNGLASFKIWSSWDHNQWQKIQSTFQMYGIELYSELQDRSETIDRLNGNIGWRRDKDLQVVSGDNITIDFPFHLWPVSHFSFTILPDTQGGVALNKLEFSYLNLGDVIKMLALTDSLLPQDLRQEMLALGAHGEITEFAASADAPAAITDSAAVTLKSSFSGLTLNAWKQFPGVTNFKGKINWDKTQGALTLDSVHVFITANDYFHNALYFDQLAGVFTLNKTTDGAWAVTAKNVKVSSPDLKASAQVNLTQAVNDTPVVDFTADFSINNAAQLATYFPLKILDPDLAKWLQTAFHRGEGFNGKAVVKGKVNEIPFDTNNGTFSITTQVKDLDLFYGPDWPPIINLAGNLAFAGRGLTITLVSGTMANVPVQNIVATVPYIGDDQPQILHINGTIASDLSELVKFINSSPLQKTLGNDLAGMDLSGPDTLKLGLVIPLRHPDNATVTGDVTITNVTMNLAEWKLTINKLNGGFQFTDQSVTAKNIQGELLGVPATLVITTLINKQKQPQIRADLTSSISVPALEEWLDIPMSKILQGSAAYQATLLFSHATTNGRQLSLVSDLKGVAVNLPAPYAKSAPYKSSFQLDIIAADKSDLKARLSYNKQISAALTLDTSSKALQIKSGELRLGGAEANWQTQPGIIVTGDMAQLNWEIWQEFFASLQTARPQNSVAQAGFTASDFKRLREIDLNIKLLQIMSQQLHQVAIKLTSDAHDWQIDLNSDELAGDITLPFDRVSNPVVAKFQRITLGAMQVSKSAKTIDPRTLPSMQLESDQTQIGDANIGHLILDLEHDAQGLKIRNMLISDDLLKFNATGFWNYARNRSSTHLQGGMLTTKVSDLLKAWGFNSSNFIGSRGDVKFDLNWPDAPYSITVEGMNGTASFNLGEGRIIELSDASNAKIGLGRMLNLFSLSTLQRRLNLDFSDVTQKGYSFDTLKGDFTLKNGSAYTSNMQFNGPIAKVAISGRVGLAAKDFDVQLAVTPYITGSLPVVAAFAGGPIVGVAALLVDKVVTSSVSRVMIYRFNVTGPWANPVTTPVKSAPTTSSLSLPIPNRSVQSSLKMRS
jgi:uncharacterized protein (TIGR02099 family)